MSDGVYLFNEAQGREIFSGTIEIFQSKLRGENDFYKYHGVFSIKNHALQGSILVKNKTTGTINRIPLSTSVHNDWELEIAIDISGQMINLIFKREREKPLMR